MVTLTILLLLVAACVGFGAVTLRLLNIRDSLSWGERAVMAFIIGIGVLGWLMFFLGAAGLFNPVAVTALLTFGALGLVSLGLPDISAGAAFSTLEKLLLAILAVALALDVLEGLSPPADGDTMAYHFALPKLFWQEGRLVFIPRAIDGAIPLLVQMTYIPALGLGGERVLTLWTMVSGWGVAWALYFLCRHSLDRSWSLALTLIWLTMPVVLYGGGSGQIEVRNAGFVIVAVTALVRGRETGLARYVILAGMTAGMFVGAKYTGLLFAAACAGALLTFRGRTRAIVLFSLVAGLAGLQWYAWNWAHTGDPVFPMLYGILGVGDSDLWDAAHHQALHNNLFTGERAIPISPLSALMYPLLTIFATSPVFDSERAGLGPFMLLALPFAVAGLWRYWRRIWASPLLPAALVVALYYGLWFFSGSSQRVRHLVPVYPVALMLAAVLACRWTQATGMAKPLILAAALTIGLQMAGHGASSLNYARHIFSGESREAFLLRNLAGYESVQMINRQLGPTDRILIMNRQMNYHLTVPYYYANITVQAQVNILPGTDDPGLYYRQLRGLGISHVLSTVFQTGTIPADEETNGSYQWRALLALGCAEVVDHVGYRAIESRSLAVWADSDAQQAILRLGGPDCPL